MAAVLLSLVENTSTNDQEAAARRIRGTPWQRAAARQAEAFGVTMSSVSVDRPHVRSVKE